MKIIFGKYIFKFNSEKIKRRCSKCEKTFKDFRKTGKSVFQTVVQDK